MINSNTDMIYHTLKGHTNGKTESRQKLHRPMISTISTIITITKIITIIIITIKLIQYQHHPALKSFCTNGKTESRQELHSTADLENIRRPATTRHLKIQRDICKCNNKTIEKLDIWIMKLLLQEPHLHMKKRTKAMMQRMMMMTASPVNTVAALKG